MATDTLTLALEGDVSLREFTQAMSNFKDVVEALTSEVAGNVRVEWFIDDLQAGSAIATVRGHLRLSGGWPGLVVEPTHTLWGARAPANDCAVAYVGWTHHLVAL